MSLKEYIYRSTIGQLSLVIIDQHPYFLVVR